MFDFDELEVAKPFKATDALGEVLYSVRAIFEAPAVEVAEAAAAALLRGEPQRVSADEHTRLFVSSPAYDEDFLKEFGRPPSKTQFFADEVAQIHCAAFSMGLRPLGPDETIQAVDVEEGGGFRVGIRRIFLHSSPEVTEPVRAWWSSTGVTPTSHVVAVEEEPLPEEEEGETDAVKGAGAKGPPPFRRSFLVRARAPGIGFAVRTARFAGWMHGARQEDDDLMVYRCTIQAVGGDPSRTEVRRELMGSNIYLIRDGDCKEAWQRLEREGLATLDLAGALPIVEKTMKHLPYFLEEEMRVWAASKGFGLVEVWRGVRRDDVNKVLAVARFVSTVYQCTPGEGAPAACERAAGVRFNMLYAKKLAARFRRKRYNGVHGGAPGGEQLAGIDGGQFTDGSVSIRGFALLLDRVCRRATPEADILRGFVDLGSGRGNAVIAAHALFPFRSCVGIEILPEHVAYARRHAEKYRDGEDFYMSASRSVDVKELFIEGDFLKGIDWSDASVVFCNAVTWPRHLIREIAYVALRLRPGAVFMLLGFGKFFPSDPEILRAFDFHSDICLVSWVDEPQGIWVFQRR